MPIILGIDPGLATVGFGVISAEGNDLKFVDCGVITTKPEHDLPERLNAIKTDILYLLDTYKPDVAGVEELFFARNVTNAIKVAHARGVILESLFFKNIPLINFTPLQVKKNIAGDGAAQKWQIQEMVKRFLKLKFIPKPDDAADALAIAICTERAYKTASLQTTKPPNSQTTKLPNHQTPKPPKCQKSKYPKLPN